MTDSGSLMPFLGAALNRSRARTPAPVQGAGPQRPAAPVHDGAGFGFRQAGRPLRDGARDAMSAAVRQRLTELAGTVIDWWVEVDDENRAEAAFFGDHGLALAMPTVNAQQRPATEISCYVLDAASLRSRTVQQQARPGRRKLPGTSVAPAGGLSALESGGESAALVKAAGGPASLLNESARGVLGNLPAEAQQLMQAPFNPGNEILGCDWHYEGSEQQISVFMMYLASARDVTVATGSSTIPGNRPAQAASWSLQVHRARVVRRIGRNTWIRG